MRNALDRVAVEQRHGCLLRGRYQTPTNRAQADGPLDVVAVDMPINLRDRGQRQADVLQSSDRPAAVLSVHDASPRGAVAADHAPLRRSTVK
jgi:hypothetical protein